jgi:hypothetical protein
VQVLMDPWLQDTLQFWALPVIWSRVHAFPSSQLEGQEAAGSHVSPPSTTPLPQLAEQSESLAELHPTGQQPSPEVQTLMDPWLQDTLQFWALPVIWSRVQALPSSQLEGQEAAGSQVSPPSTTPLPQLAEQSESLAELHPTGQQPSPGVQAVIAVEEHVTLQVTGPPVIWSEVHALPSLQLVAQEAAGSHVSPLSTRPLPQTGWTPPPLPPAARPAPPVPPGNPPVPPVTPLAPPVQSGISSASSAPPQPEATAALTTATAIDTHLRFMLDPLSALRRLMEDAMIDTYLLAGSRMRPGTMRQEQYRRGIYPGWRLQTRSCWIYRQRAASLRKVTAGKKRGFQAS